MSLTSTTCPAARDLELLLAGRMAGPAADVALDHLEQCGRCLAVARTLAPADPLLEALRQGPPGVDPAAAERAAGLIAHLREHRPARADALTVDAVAPHPAGGAAETHDAIAAGPGQAAAREAYAFLAPPQESDEIGRLGPYRVLRVLGRGGMGVVFHAEDPQLQRGVALKVMHPAVAASASAGQRFLREARATAALKHDHVVTIYQVGEDRGVPFLAMELLEGESLEQRLMRPDPLPAAEVLRIGREIAEGLEASHSHGLIHRDVKPSNVWLEAGRGRVKILDFGLARPESPGDGQLTQEGLVVGTPAFMAPEQAKGQPVDKRCDLFSLGCVLYRLCTGRNPFVSPHALSLLVAVINETPSPPAEAAPDLPPGLSDLIVRLLAKDPADRPSSAAAVAAALEEIGRGDAIPMPSPAAPPRRRRRIAVLGVCLLVLGLAVAAAVVLRVQTPDGEVVVRTDDSDIELTATKGGALVRIHDLKSGHTWQLDANKYTLGMADDGDGLTIDLPDGQPMVLRRKGDGVVTITRQTAAKPAVVEPPKDHVPLDALRREDIPRAALGWPGGGDPDRAPPELVAILGDGRFRLLEEPGFPAYSPDGKLLAVPSGFAVFVFDAASGQYLRTLAGHTAQVNRVLFSPDGKVLASASWDHTIRLWETASGRHLRTLTGHSASVHGLAFSRDRHTLASSDRSGAVMVWDLPAGQGRPMSGKHDGLAVSVAFSLDGKTLASAGEADGVVRLWDPATGDLKSRLTPASGELHREVAFSPNGNSLACGSDATLTVWDAKTFHEKFTVPASAAGCTVFTTDSRTVVTATHDLRAGAVPRVARWDAGTGKLLGMFPVRSRGDWAFYSLAPDGATVAALGMSDRVAGVYDLVTGKPRFPVTGHNAAVRHLSFSPDGRFLASAGADGAIKLWDMSLGQEVRVLSGHSGEVNSVAFSPDGKQLASGGTDKTVRLWDPGTGHLLWTFPEQKELIEQVAFSPDGKLLASAGWDRTVRLWDVAGRFERRVLSGFGGMVDAVAFSHDGRALAVGSADGGEGCASVWDVDSGERRRCLKHPNCVKSVCFLSDDLTLATGTDDGVVRLWSLPTGSVSRQLPGWGACIVGLALRPDDRLLAACGFDAAVRLWDLSTDPPRRQTLRLFPYGAPWSHGVAFSPDGRHLAAGNPDGTIYLFRLGPPGPGVLPGLPRPDPETDLIREFKARQDWINFPIFSRDGKRIFSPGSDGDVRELDTATGEELHRLHHPDKVWRLALTPDDRFLVSVCWDQLVRVWDVTTGQELRRLDGKHNGWNVALTADGKQVVLLIEESTATGYFDIATGKEVRRIPCALGTNFLTPDGKHYLAAGERRLELIDAATGEAVLRLMGHSTWIRDTAVSADGRYAASSSGSHFGPDPAGIFDDCTVRMWDLRTGCMLWRRQESPYTRTGIAFTPDDRRVVAGSFDHSIHIYDTETGKENACLDTPAPVGGVAVSPDGKAVLAGGTDGVLRLYRLPDN